MNNVSFAPSVPSKLLKPLTTYAPTTTTPSSLPQFNFHIAATVLVAFAAFIFFKLPSTHRSPTSRHSHNIDISKPQLLRCNISHQRLRPKTHGFKYRYLSLGVPVRRAGREEESNWRWGRKWGGVFGFNEDVHLGGLEGEKEGLGLWGKLRGVLEGEGLSPNNYPDVWLLTAPTVLGYTFSPASFWFLYKEQDNGSGDLCLEKIVAEVNNTFGEKRSYVFSRLEQKQDGLDVDCDQKQSDTSLMSFGINEKDFHVSPFSSRNGTYTLAACDPRLTGKANVRVTLQTSKGDTKLVARWYTTDQAVDVQNPSWKEVMGVVGGWAWLGLVTWPRIVLNAIILAQKKKLHIWYRPEPRQTTVARKATKSELLHAKIFTDYMRHLLSFSTQNLDITIRSGVPMRRTRDESAKLETSSNLELRILTPQFYRQLITYETLSSFLSYTLLNPWEENHTANAFPSATSIISTILSLEKEVATAESAMHKQSFSTFISGPVWILFRILRSTDPAQKGVYPSPGLPSARIKTSVVGESDGEVVSEVVAEDYFLDGFVRSHYGFYEQAQYVSAVLWLQLRTRIMKSVGGE